METKKSLRRGRIFEREVFGITEESEFTVFDHPPVKRSYEVSLQLVIKDAWSGYCELVEKGTGFAYNPTDPKVGKTSAIFSAVKKHLPRWVLGKRSPVLNFYIAVGRTSLDWYYGVDAFFWWEGAIATIDVSLYLKDPQTLKADFLLLPEDLEKKDRLDSLGKQIATRLKERRLIARSREKKFKPKTEFEQQGPD